MIGGKSIMLPKFMAEFLIESCVIIKELERGLNTLNVNDFKDF